MRRRLLPPFASRRKRRAGEAGFALPTVLFMLLGAFAVASIGAVSSIRAQHGTSRDLDTKDALAVAEAGVHQALLRYNAAGVSEVCVSAEPSVDGWCAPAEGSFPRGAEFAYWVRPDAGLIEVVSQGSRDGVTRRLHVQARSAAGLQPFIDAGVIGRDGIQVDQNATIVADAATNGDVNLGANSTLCGSAQVPEGQVVTDPPGSHKSLDCETAGSVIHGDVSLPPVNQGDVRENNDNGNFFDQTPIQGKRDRVCFDGRDGDGAPSEACGARELVLWHNSSITLRSGNYSVCRISLLQKSAIYIANGATVRIYFDDPQECGHSEPGPVTQLELHSNSRITSNGTAVDIALLFVGSETIATDIDFRSNTETACEQSFVVYAPRTDLEMASNSSYCGAVAAKSVHINQNVQITTSNEAQEFVLPNSPPHYVIDRYVECAGPAPSQPDAGC